MHREVKEKSGYAIVAAVQLPNVSDIEFESSLAELRDLAKTLGYEISASFTQKRSSFDATAYLGTGKREEIRAFVDNEPVPGAFEKAPQAAADPSAGKSHTELDKRKIRDRIAELQQEIIAMDAERKTQRARRQERQGLATVALIGYTNAGKSTLMRALTGSDVLVENKLFATLDTTVRALQPESRPRVLVSDTVGFIKNLPHGLVASFKSTLEEALDASLLIHVIDASDPGFERQIEVTDKVIDEIGARDAPRIRVFNKIDHVGNAAAQAEREAALRVDHPACIVMSARRADDVTLLREAIVAFFRQDLVEADLFLPWSAQQQRRAIFASFEVLEERADAEGAFLRVRGEREAVQGLREQIARV